MSASFESLLRTDFTLTLTLRILSSILLTVLAVPTWFLDNLASSPWMVDTDFSMDSCRASSPFWVCWIWSTTPMILSSRDRTMTPFICASLLPPGPAASTGSTSSAGSSSSSTAGSVAAPTRATSSSS
ncbi:hypothetical protein EYF80_048137 [Liparis tanakae]|uniref:Uncharacterized protein n=1 Tax=Liparis tanakae TaxID=230148 RepID=A0A4Z2FLR6_9TELE|nr:hypothetical protein EYF80_048137 [Liparis tanakae]